MTSLRKVYNPPPLPLPPPTHPSLPPPSPLPPPPHTLYHQEKVCPKTNWWCLHPLHPHPLPPQASQVKMFQFFAPYHAPWWGARADGISRRPFAPLLSSSSCFGSVSRGTWAENVLKRRDVRSLIVFGFSFRQITAITPSDRRPKKAKKINKYSPLYLMQCFPLTRYNLSWQRQVSLCLLPLRLPYTQLSATREWRNVKERSGPNGQHTPPFSCHSTGYKYIHTHVLT